jgi:hypothetical protein
MQRVRQGVIADEGLVLIDALAGRDGVEIHQSKREG